VSHLLGKTIRDKSGFTLIEILMVLLLIAILTALGITQFTNFSTEAKNNTVKSNLKILRNAIATQNSQMRLRCNITSTAWPALAAITGNDITAGGQCTVVQVGNPADRVFVQGGIPINSWGSTGVNTVNQCTGGGCTARNTQCVGGGARAGTDDGWCYDVNTGDIWADSARNDGANAGTGNEYSF
jgi:prepilin-type N-terminal cleavage/methylation domain-containing protein